MAEPRSIPQEGDLGRMMICGRCGALAALGSSPPLCSRCASSMPEIAALASVTALPRAQRVSRPDRDDGHHARRWDPTSLAGILGCVASSFVLMLFLVMLLQGAAEPGPSSPGARAGAIGALALGAVGLAFAVGVLRGSRAGTIGNAAAQAVGATWWTVGTVLAVLDVETAKDLVAVALIAALAVTAGVSAFFSIEMLRAARRHGGA